MCNGSGKTLSVSDYDVMCRSARCPDCGKKVKVSVPNRDCGNVVKVSNHKVQKAE